MVIAFGVVYCQWAGEPAKPMTLTVPQDFYALRPYHGVKQIQITDDAPIFYILVHGTFHSAEDNTPQAEEHYWGEKEFTEDIPKDFFGPGSNDGKAPIRLTFGWSGGWNDQARKEGGAMLAKGISYLKTTFPHSRVICVGHSHGGNVINVASKQLKPDTAIDCAINLATPVISYNTDKDRFDDKTGYYPSADGMRTLISFYSERDFVQSMGAGASAYKRRYAPIPGIDVYNVRLRKLKGEDDAHSKMRDAITGAKILQLCHKIKQIYKGNKNLIADITPDANSKILVSIKPYKPNKSEVDKVFKGKATDSFWPDWTGKNPDEIKASEADALVFKKRFGFPIDKRSTDLERATFAVQYAGEKAQHRIERGAAQVQKGAEKSLKDAKKGMADAQKKLKSLF
jgi:hypothetical protein